MKSILEDIKTQNFKQAYLLYGEEAYLKHQYKNKLKNALLPEDDTMNFSRFEGKGTEIPKVIDLAETMPFFADRRVILLENTGFFKNKADALADYMGSLPDYLVLIFVEEEVDKRNRMYKAVQKQGRAVEFARQDEKTLMTWVLGMMKKEGKKITRQDMEDFLEKTGTDMGNISQELEKLLSYTMGRDVITRADIEAVCTTQITNRIFEMIRAVTEKKQRKALDLYQDLLALKEPPMRILFLLARQFNLLLHADLVIITVRHNAGADFGHSKLLETKFYYRGTCRGRCLHRPAGRCRHPHLQMGCYFSNASRRLRSYGVS